MKQSVFLVLYLFCATLLRAQQQYFIFIEAENNQLPFYARINDRQINASAFGHISFPGLGEGIYEIAIGFPQHQFPEQYFMVKLVNKDRGFQLRKNGEKSWELYDWQNRETIAVEKLSPDTSSHHSNGILKQVPPEKTVSHRIVDSVVVIKEKREDPFARLMAAVVNDTSVLYTTYTKTIPRPAPVTEPDTSRFIPADTIALVHSELKLPPDTSKIIPRVVEENPRDLTGIKEMVPEQKEKDKEKQTDTLRVTEPVDKPKDSLLLNPFASGSGTADSTKDSDQVRKLAEKEGDGGHELVFLDFGVRPGADTVKITIPRGKETGEKDSTKQEVLQVIDSSKSKGRPPGSDSVAKPVTPVATDSSNHTSPKPAEKEPGVPANTPGKKSLVMINSDCRNFASEQDMEKLRIKMLAEKDPDDRIMVARKFFRARCFTVQQVRLLSGLFDTDEYRYHFFDAAYPFVSDTDHFPSLQELLSDEYYINRFRAMVRRG